MLKSRAYHQLTFEIAEAPGSDALCYMLLPQGATAEIGKWAESAAIAYNCNMVLVSGMDWNNDMTPWPADGVMKKQKDFGGNAGAFLKVFLEDYVPNVEGWLKLASPKRYLIGVSLSGLFALWTLFKTDRFDGIASVSGSLWYDNLVEWVAQSTHVPASRLYLSLGVRENLTPDKKMARVEERTCAISELLASRGHDIIFEMVSGTHFSPLPPKFDKAMAALTASAKGLLDRR